MASVGRYPDPLDLRLVPRREEAARQGTKARSLAGWLRWLILGSPPREFELRSPFRYIVSEQGSGLSEHTVTVPRGTIVNGGSIPPLFWPVIGPPMGDYAEATVVHDYQCQAVVRALQSGLPVDFRWASLVFADGLRTLGIGPRRRRLMFWAVAANGRRVVRQYRRRRRRGDRRMVGQVSGNAAGGGPGDD